MADAFRGLTLRLGADARPVKSALDYISRSAAGVQKQLNKMGKALRFDGTNMGALRQSMDLAGDKAAHMATSMRTAAAAMRQVGSETSKFGQHSEYAGKTVAEVARSIKNVSAAVQRTREEAKTANAQLQHIYDSAKKIVEQRVYAPFATAAQKAELADKYVKQIQQDLSKTGAKADSAFDAMNKFIAEATKNPKMNLSEKFGLGKTEADAKALYDIFVRLRGKSAELDSDLKALKQVEGFRALKTEVIAYESALRETVTETVRLKSELYALGSAPGLAKAVASIRSLGVASDAATADARTMKAAYDAFPLSVEAARNKLLAANAAQDALVAKTAELRAAMAKIESNGSFDKTKAAAMNVHLEFEKASRAAVDLGTQVEKAEARLNELKKKTKLDMNMPDEEVAKLSKELGDAVTKLAELRSKALLADEALERAASYQQYQKLNSELAETATRLSEVNAKTSTLANIAGNMRTTGYGLYSTLTPAITIMGRYAVQAANDVDSAYRDMRKTVNGTEEEFEHLRQAALEFGRTHVTSADQILEIEAIGGQLGVASTNLEKFSEVVSNLDIATNMDTETISENLGQLTNIMKDMNQDLQSGPGSMEAFSDSLVRLGNNSAAQEDKIMKVMMRIASVGTISGMTTPELLALSTAVAAAGQGSEAAGTAISRTFSQIEAAVGGGGEKLAKFAEVAAQSGRMSADEFASAWQERPMEAFQALIEGLKKVDDSGGSVVNTLSDLGINAVRQRQTLMNLTNTTDVLAKSIGMSNAAWLGQSYGMDAAGDAAREAQRKSEGFSGQLQMMKNAAQELGVELMDGAVPMLKGMTRSVQEVAGAMNAMPDWERALVVKAAIGLAAIGPLLVGVGALADGVQKLNKVTETVQAFSVRRKAMAELRAQGVVLERSFASQKKNIAAIDDALAKNAASIEKVNASQARHVASLGTESAALSGQKRKLEESRASLQAQKTAYAGAAAAANTFKTTLKTIGATAGIMVALEVIGQIVGKVQEYVEAEREFEQATRGLEEATASFSASMSASAASMSAPTTAFVDYARAIDDAVQGNIELADTIRSNQSTATQNTGLVQAYADKIAALSDNCGNASDSITELETYIASFNALTGSSIEIIDKETGALNVSAEQLAKYVELYKKKAEVDASKNNMEDAAKRNAENQAALNTALEREKELRAQIAEIEAANASGEGPKRSTVELNTELEMTLGFIEKLKPAAESSQGAYDSFASSFESGSAEMATMAEELGLSVDSTTGQIVESGEELDEETQKAIASFEALCASSDEFRRVVGDIDGQAFISLLDQMGLSMDDVAAGMDDMVAKVSDGLNAIEVDSEMSLQKYLENLQHNKEVTEAWGDNLKSLYDRTADETVRAWVSEVAKAGPEEAALVAEMAAQDDESLMAMARSWQEARDMGANAYLDSVRLTSEETQELIANMVSNANSALDELDGREIHYTVTDDGTIQLNLDELDDLEREALSSKGYEVTDNGTIRAMSDDLSAFKQIEIDGKHFYVTDDGTILNESREVTDLKATLETVPEEVKTQFLGDNQDVMNKIRDVRDAINELPDDKWITIHVKHESDDDENASGGVIPANAAGGATMRNIRRIPAHADGGINGIVTRRTLTNVGWVGEAGAEAVLHMKHAGGAIVPLTNRRYVRPFARAVAAEMGGFGGRTVNVELNLNYDAGDDAIALARDVSNRVESLLNMGV